MRYNLEHTLRFEQLFAREALTYGVKNAGSELEKNGYLWIDRNSGVVVQIHRAFQNLVTGVALRNCVIVNIYFMCFGSIIIFKQFITL